ncbi:MAG: hypothetical protein Q8N89_14605 [Azonexus sp.]|nr:hypothetical protein [Azonexus sp.]
MNHPMPKASLAERRSATTASASQSPPIRKRGFYITLVGSKTFDTDGERHPGNFRPETHSAVASLIEQSPSTDKADAGKKKPRKKRTKPQSPEYLPVPVSELKWLTIAQAAIRFPNYSEKAYRHLVAQAEAYAKHPKSGLRSNGFLPCVVRPAGKRKILINAEKFEEWLKSFAVSAS